MLQGEIIKFYREQANLTQAQLSDGICTTTHISKIERGKTAYSEDLITLFSERLEIDIQQEIKRISQIEKLLKKWLNAFVEEDDTLIEQLKIELETIPFIYSTHYTHHYHLLLARYFIYKKQYSKANTQIQLVESQIEVLTSFEKNLYYHTKGIYYISDKVALYRDGQHLPMMYLQKVDIGEYGQKEYLHHLAVACHLMGASTLAYKYADHALRYFQETYNYKKSILAEAIILLQVSQEKHMHFADIILSYHQLIDRCESLGLQFEKLLLMNNLGFEYFNRAQYHSAAEWYEQVLIEGDEWSPNYLKYLSNYVDSCLEGKIGERRKVIHAIKKGFILSKKHKSKHYTIIFSLLELKAKGNYDAYFHYLEDIAVPYFEKSHHTIYLKRYRKVLYDYYVQHQKYRQASLILVGDR